MTIHDIEAATGIKRANIRFYESEGLISPARKENGYRSYSQGDVDALLRIKLLRELGISIDEIRSAKSGSIPLSFILRNHIDMLSNNRAHISDTSDVCLEMVHRGVTYDSLNAQEYFDIMSDSSPAEEEIRQDTSKSVVIRRVAARVIDLMLLEFIYYAILRFHFNIDTDVKFIWIGVIREYLYCVVPFVAAILIEPVLLALTGTTPGKWLMGLCVVAPDGQRLTYKEALSRTALLFVCGFGLGIPLLMVILAIRRRKEKEGRWEWDSRVISAKPAVIRYIFGGALLALTVFGFIFIGYAAKLPPNRGDISCADFAENVNDQLEYNMIANEFCYKMHRTGIWQLDEDYDPSDAWGMRKNAWKYPPADVQIVTDLEENVHIIRFRYDYSGTDAVFFGSIQDEMYALTLAFVGKDMGIFEFSRFRSKIMMLMNDGEPGSFDFEYGKYICSCTFENVGYSLEVGVFTPSAEFSGTPHLTFDFELRERI